MTTINNSDDLLQLLRENPEFYQEVRRLILTDELIALPGQFVRFVERVEGFIASQEQFNDEQRQFNDEQRQFNNEQRQFNNEQRQFNRRLETAVGELQGNAARQEQFNDQQRQFNRRLETAVGELRGNAARQVTGALAEEVAESLGLEFRNTLSRDELRAIVGPPGLSGVDRGDRLSFIRADLVMAAADPAGETHHIAVEASYTGDQRDTARARRNAELLQSLTGHPSHAVVASVRNVREIQPEIDNSQVHWYELDPDDFTPD